MMKGNPHNLLESIDPLAYSMKVIIINLFYSECGVNLKILCEKEIGK